MADVVEGGVGSLGGGLGSCRSSLGLDDVGGYPAFDVAEAGVAGLLGLIGGDHYLPVGLGRVPAPGRVGRDHPMVGFWVRRVRRRRLTTVESRASLRF